MAAPRSGAHQLEVLSLTISPFAQEASLGLCRLAPPSSRFLAAFHRDTTENNARYDTRRDGAPRAQLTPPPPGGIEIVNAGGFKAGEAVSAVLQSTPVKLGNFTANASGVVTVPFTVPTTLETGAHSVVLTGLTSGRVATAHFTVLAAPADLASTGVMHIRALLATGA